MAKGFSVYDKSGRLVLTALARDKSDALRAAVISYGAEYAPFRVSAFPAGAARAAIDYWQNNFSTDKACDLTTNQGWDAL